MRNSFKSLFVLFLMLVGVHYAHAQIDMSSIDPDNPGSWFYVNLTANVSNPNCGNNNPGKVYLIYTDADDSRTPQNPYLLSTKPSITSEYSDYAWAWDAGFDEGKSAAENGQTKDVTYGTGENPFSYSGDESTITNGTAARVDGYNVGYNWYKSGHYLNTSNPTGVAKNSSAWGATASLKGYSYLYAPGFDDLMGYSAYAYFFGKAAENDGWYFTGWSFTEGESDLGGVVGTADSLQFRVLPSAKNGEENIRNENVYATFQPVMVSNYKVNGLINTSVSNSTTVIFDAVGQRVSTADFTVAVPEANFSAALTSCADNKVTVTVTYSGSTDGEYRGNVTLASKSGCSQLTAPVYARVGADGSNDATLYDGKTPTSISGTLNDMIAAANNTDKIVVLNKNIEAATTVNATVTINFNGYNIDNTLTISGGEVTIAYSKYGGGADALYVTGGKAILNGGEFGALTVGASGTVEQNGATITGAATNNGSLTTTEGRFEAGLTSSKNLTIDGGTFEGSTAITVSGGTANINKGTIAGTTYGVQATGGTTNITSKLVSVYGGTNAVKQSSGKVNLTNGKYSGATPLAGTINLQAGYFKVDGEHLGIAVPEDKKVLNVLAGTEFAEGYRYFVGDDASSIGVCRIGTTSYAKLEDALAYANNNPDKDVVIIMTNNYTMPAGYYTLPAKATLIIPMSNEQETDYPLINRVSNNRVTKVPYEQPTEFRRLTFSEGVNLDVYGLIEITGTQRASDDAYATLPHGEYGLLVMEEGSHMTLQNNSELRAWGYMIGKGETDARRGATVREQFQMGDWKGGGISFSMLGDGNSDKRVFPITQYYIQNIEAPVKYHPGAVLSTTTSVSADFGSIGITAMANDIAIVGVNGVHTAMFLMDQEADAENTWVRKWYDVEHDIQTYEVNSGAHLGSMVLDLGKLGTNPLVMNSGYFVLPITNNMKIHLLSGMMDFTQTTSLLPGAEVEVDKESVIKIVDNPDPSVFDGALYVYDADDWQKANGKGDAGTLYTKVVPYSPSVGGKPSVRTETEKPADAKINVHGSFDSGDGAVYTTPGGANIFSTNEDAGTFVFSKKAPTTTSDVYQYVNGSGYTSVAAESAKLKNGTGAAEPYAETTGAGANQVFMYTENVWNTAPNLFYFDCFTAEVDMTIYAQEVVKKASAELYDLGKAVTHLYIKPQEWVEIVGKANIDFENDPYNPYLDGVTGNSDHTFSDAAGAGRLFILMDKGCQWWEVEKKDNLYHCIHPENDTYYYWDDSSSDPDDHHWAEKTFTITWRNYDGTIIKTANKSGVLQDSYVVTYGTQAEFLGTNPTRPADIDYTYDFTGWSPELAPVTSNVTYTATYEKKERKYTIIFLQEGGVEIERQFLPHNAVPVCENTPTKIGHTLVWSPAIAAVTGDATYTATWEEEPPTKYEVTFYDYDGTTPLQQSDVNVGDMPTFNGETPTGKPATSEFTYVFDHWSPEPEVVSATSVKSYVAVYREVPETYTVIFLNEDNSEIERHEYAYGETPVCSATPSKEPTAQYTYTFAWTPQIETVRKAETYKATFTPVTNRYTITLKANPSGACSFTGAGTFDYGTDVSISRTDNEGYTFQKWTDKDGNEVSVLPTTLTSDINLVANFTVADPDWTITWKNEAGTANLVTPVGQKAGTATTYTGATPTKPATAQYTYTFYGWSTEANGGGTIYKNGLTPKATAPATYYAYFTESLNKYKVTLLSNNSDVCTLFGAGTYEYGTTAHIFAKVRDGYEFVKWEWAETHTTNADLGNVEVQGDITYTAVVREAVVDKKVGIKSIYAVADGDIVKDLILESNGNASGQITNATALSVEGNAYFDLSLNADAQTWYAFGLPWQVDATSGVSVKGGAQLILDNTYHVLYYDGANRAQYGKANGSWKFLADKSDKTLEPGTLYLIYLNSAANTLRFTKKNGASINNISVMVEQYPSQTGDDKDANWNGIANPAVYYAYMNAGVEYGQHYNDGPFEMSTHKFIVGEPIFVQTPAKKSVVADNSQYPASAPRRNVVPENDNKAYEIRIAPLNAEFADRIYVRPAEEKMDKYIIGKDLAKISVSTKAPQMWVNRYDAKLCVNTIEEVDNQATFPLGIYAPADGQYTISTVTPVAEDEELFITVNGAPVWNLAQGEYNIDLKAGNTDAYGLLLVRERPIPEVTTGCESVKVADKASIRKVLINGQVFIIRDGAVYTIFGQKAK